MLAIALLTFGATLFAQQEVTPAVGEEAVELGDPDFAMNEPESSSIKDKLGEVVFIEYWGVK